MDVAAASAPSPRDDDALAVSLNVEQERAGIRVEALRPDWNVYDESSPGLPILIFATPVFAAFGLEYSGQRHIEQGGLALVAEKDNVATLAAIAARWASVRDVFLAAKCHATVASSACSNLYFAGVDEFHGNEVVAPESRGAQLRPTILPKAITPCAGGWGDDCAVVLCLGQFAPASGLHSMRLAIEHHLGRDPTPQSRAIFARHRGCSSVLGQLEVDEAIQETAALCGRRHRGTLARRSEKEHAREEVQAAPSGDCRANCGQMLRAPVRSK